jgi:ubiquinone/menaquinone biosynthesis C-methylase UbiE
MKKLFGNEMDRMPNIAFKMMALMFKIRDAFVSVDNLLEKFDIQKGQTVVDYGCGPGSYLSKASELVGPEGTVFAVDVHELAVKAVEKRIQKEGLANVTGLLAEKGNCPLENGTADVIYALDMFHMVGDANAFLKNLRRICKPEAVLYIDDGHQPRQEAKEKIVASGAWEIVEEKKRYLKCRTSGGR